MVFALAGTAKRDGNFVKKYAAPRNSFFIIKRKRKTFSHTQHRPTMSSYNSIYASLAQISVQGQANAELAKHESGKLDIFTSAFYTHKTFACGFIRHEDQAEIKNAAVASFQPLVRSTSSTMCSSPQNFRV